MTTFYVDSVGGSDAQNGTSEATAWKSIAKVNAAALVAGDRVLFKRGSGWTGTRLNLTRPGSAAAPIIISSYGTGPLPVIRDSTSGQISIRASYYIVRRLSIDMDWALLPKQDVGNGPIPVQTGLYGINVANNAQYVTIERCRIRHQMAGIHVGNGSPHVNIWHNQITDNGVMEQLSVSNPGSDLGAWGINVIDDYADVGWNYLANNVAPHQNAAGTWHSNSVEYYRSKHCRTHHNQSWGDRVFTEIGGDTNSGVIDLPDDNVWAYNLHVTGNLPNCRFFNAHGSNDIYGPCTNNVVIHNTVVFTFGSGEVGIISGDMPTPADMTVHSNIIWSDDTTIDPRNPINNHNNCYWKTGGAPHQSWPTGGGMGAGDIIADPKFVNKPGNDFRLQSGSPCLDTGSGIGGYATDIAGNPSVAGTVSDMGVYERQC